MHSEGTPQWRPRAAIRQRRHRREKPPSRVRQTHPSQTRRTSTEHIHHKRWSVSRFRVNPPCIPAAFLRCLGLVSPDLDGGGRIPGSCCPPHARANLTLATLPPNCALQLPASAHSQVPDLQMPLDSPRQAAPSPAGQSPTPSHPPAKAVLQSPTVGSAGRQRRRSSTVVSWYALLIQ